MKTRYDKVGKPLPKNKDISNDKHKDKILRELDCAVIEFMHSEIIDNKDFSVHDPFDSVRGVFTEGGPAFEGSGLFEKTHIQIYIRNPNCIEGFFIPRKEIEWNGTSERIKR